MCFTVARLMAGGMRPPGSTLLYSQSRITLIGRTASRTSSTRRRLNLSHIRLRSKKVRCEAEEKPPLVHWFSPPPNAFSIFGDRRRRIANSTKGAVDNGRDASAWIHIIVLSEPHYIDWQHSIPHAINPTPLEFVAYPTPIGEDAL